MDFSSVNWLAVLVCVVISMISGTIWYNPKTFFPTWWAVVGGGKEQPGGENMGMVWGLTLLAALVQAIFLSLLVNGLSEAMGGASVGTGMQIGFFLWLSLVAPTNLVNKLFAGHGLKIWAIEAGNHLLNFLLFGAVLGAWQ